ncbi:hypothetical protein EYF80_049230 [Liparis tanakae]|uniref:Uncharacterized protein n=1 Tax=Liparis tanakae TaxID=230148 RepID=A0A4Z2FIJ4_9TELE|nr:hypothetical protein EYF80_049230 [Liparis tanakae]
MASFLSLASRSWENKALALQTISVIRGREEEEPRQRGSGSHDLRQDAVGDLQRRLPLDTEVMEIQTMRPPASASWRDRSHWTGNRCNYEHSYLHRKEAFWRRFLLVAHQLRTAEKADHRRGRYHHLKEPALLGL